MSDARRVSLAALSVVATLALLPSCAEPPTCLGNGCENSGACAPLRSAFPCTDSPTLAIGSATDIGIDLDSSEGVGADLVLQNSKVTAVFDALASPRGLAPTGGTLIDYGPRGGKDSLNAIYQLAGILPDDAFAYDRMTLIDESESAEPHVGVVFHGSLDGRSEVKVVTRYELHGCEPGLRVYSELYNGTAEPFVFILADTPHWGSRNTLPFAPLSGQGFDQPTLDLIDIQDVFFENDYVLARSAEAATTTYGFVSCERETLTAVNDAEISAIGSGVELTRPGETRSLSRFITASAGRDLDAGLVDVLAARRALLVSGPPITVRATVTVGGETQPGRLERSSLLIAADEGGEPRPLTVVVPGAAGEITATIPRVPLIHYQLWSFGRPVAEGTVQAGADVDLGTIDVAEPARVSLEILSRQTEDSALPIAGEVVINPMDEETRVAVTGTWFGRFGDCAPWLGSPVGGSPACNQVFVDDGGAIVEIPPGRYRALATAGPNFTVGQAIFDLKAGDNASASIEIIPLVVSPPQWLSADLHVHGRASFDSSLPDIDRVNSFVAHRVDVIAATDHDAIVDYAEAVSALDVGDRLRVIGGLETTPLIPFLDVPNSDLPHVVGHFNHWPLSPDPSAARGGALFDELLEPGELFDRLAPELGADGISMLNHAWDDPRFGRDLGYLRSIGFDPREPLPAFDDGSSGGMLIRSPSGGRRNIDFDVMEIQNSSEPANVIVTRPLWFSLLNQGVLVPGTSVSDSHSLTGRLGYGRTWVDAGFGLEDFDVGGFNRALKDGRAIGSTGVVIIATIDGLGPSVVPRTASASTTVEIEVRAAPWVPVTEVRAVSSRGDIILASGSDLAQPESALDSGPIVRWRGSVELADLIGGGDDWLVIEAGIPLPQAADLDDDGVADTSDNNGDGVIDARDIEDPDDDSGPLEGPPDPTVESDPLFIYNQLLPRAWSYGFTNPFVIDRNGDGWQPPGL